MYCKKCGKEITDVTSRFCPHCGAELDPVIQEENNIKPVSGEANDDSFIFALLSFFVPIVGIIFYFVWHDSMPKRASACLKGALISIGIGILFFLLFACAAGVAYNNQPDEVDPEEIFNTIVRLRYFL